MKLEQYNNIIKQIKSMKMRKDKCISKLTERYKGVTEDTFISIYSLYHQRRIKKVFKIHHKKENMKMYYQKYKNSIQKKQSEGFLCRLADQIEFPATLLARIIMEQYFIETVYHDSKVVTKGYISKYMKDPSLIQDPVLAREVQLCIDCDDYCGPCVEKIKRDTGIKCEKLLHDILTQHSIPYYDEEILRNEGYDKTPDFKLVVPISVDDHVVNWIESKASFGDTESHTSYLEKQFWSYANRFGPGLVIYWYGFIDELNINIERGIMLMDKFPLEFVKLETLLDEHEESFILNM